MALVMYKNEVQMLFVDHTRTSPDSYGPGCLSREAKEKSSACMHRRKTRICLLTQVYRKGGKSIVKNQAASVTYKYWNSDVPTVQIKKGQTCMHGGGTCSAVRVLHGYVNGDRSAV
jgi:hypothetical protein